MRFSWKGSLFACCGNQLSLINSPVLLHKSSVSRRPHKHLLVFRLRRCWSSLILPTGTLLPPAVMVYRLLLPALLARQFDPASSTYLKNKVLRCAYPACPGMFPQGRKPDGNLLPVGFHRLDPALSIYLPVVRNARLDRSLHPKRSIIPYRTKCSAPASLMFLPVPLCACLAPVCYRRLIVDE